jgi:hypothetical protein
MNNLPAPVTPAEAEAVWAGMAHPSARRVATALTQSGRRIHFSTVARWKAEGWRSVEHGAHPLEMAMRAIDVALPVLTGDATMTANDFVRGHPVAKELMEASPQELLSLAMSEAATLQIIVSSELCRHADELISSRPGEVAVLLNALAATSRALNAVPGQVLDLIRAEDEAMAASASKG